MSKQLYKRLFEVRNYIIRTEIAAWGNTLWNKRIHGAGSRDFYFIVKKNKIQAYMNEQDLEVMPSAGFRNFTNRRFVSSDIRDTRIVLDQMAAMIHTAQRTNLAELSTTALHSFAKRYFAALTEVYGRFQTTAPWYFSKVEEHIRSYLRVNIAKAEKREEILRLLSRPVKRFEFQDEDAGLIALVIKMRRLSGSRKLLKSVKSGSFLQMLKCVAPTIYQALNRHQKRFAWINADSNLIDYSMDDVADKCIALLRLPTTELSAKLRQTRVAQTRTKRENARLLKRYPLPLHYRWLFRMLQEYAHLRFVIRFTWTRGMYYSLPLYAEIGRRVGLQAEDAHYCLTTELLQFLQKKKRPDIQSIRMRRSLYVIHMRDYRLYLSTGRAATRLARFVQSHTQAHQSNEVHGEVGSPGKFVGRVKVLTYDLPLLPQIAAMRKGQVLVAGQTRPEIIAACRKAGAIVTNEGGITSHAAVVSREFKIPCVIGTKVATDIFKNGDRVEVDATKGIVKKLP